MNARAVFLLFTVVSTFGGLGRAQSEVFRTPERLTTKDGKAIDVGDGYGYACASLTDIDGDGREDLVVGQFEGGRFRIYKNTGSAPARSFEAPVFLKIGEEIAGVPMS